MLVAESEVYRQTVKLELENLRIYTHQKKRAFSSLRLASPLIMGVFSWATGKRRLGWREIGTLALLGWQWWRRFGNRRRTQEETPGETAAEKFLRENM